MTVPQYRDMHELMGFSEVWDFEKKWAIVNGQRPSFFELLARLPARVWLQASAGPDRLRVLAVLGFAVIAGFVAVVLVILLVYRLRAWLVAPVRRPRRCRRPPDRPGRNVTDVTYEIVDRRDDGGSLVPSPP